MHGDDGDEPRVDVDLVPAGHEWNDAVRHGADEDLQRAPRERERDRHGDRRQHAALDEELPQHPGPARTDGQPECDLALPIRAAREQQVHDVRAADAEHEQGADLNHSENPIDALIHQPCRERQHPHREPLVLARMLLQQPVADDRHLRLGLLERPPGRKAGDDGQVARASILLFVRRELPRSPEGRGHRNVEIRRRDADDLVRLAVDAHRFADDVRPRAEAPPPQTVTQHDDARVARHVAVFDESSCHRRLADRREELARDAKSLNALRLGAAREVHLPVGERRHAIEGGRLRLPVEEVGRRDGLCRKRLAIAVLGDDGQSIDVLQVERTKNERVEQRECRGVGAQADRERQHDGGGDERIAGQRAHRDTDFLEQRGHGAISDEQERGEGTPAGQNETADAVRRQRENLPPVPDVRREPAASGGDREPLLGEIAKRGVAEWQAVRRHSREKRGQFRCRRPIAWG